MMSASVPWPARCGPAPGPVMVTCPTGVAWKTRALVAPSMPASGSEAGTASGRTRAVTVLNYVAGIIRRHLRAIGSRWRKLNSGQEALLVLAYLRKGETCAQLAVGFGIGRTTAWRYVNETVDLLAARAPKLRKAVRDAKGQVTPMSSLTAR